MKLLKKVTLGLLGTSLIVTSAFANTQKEEEKIQEETAKSASKFENLKQVEGTVIQHKFVNVFKDKKQMEESEKSGKAPKDKQMLIVMLKTDKGNDRLIVDLGQMKDVPKIKDGETKLQVEGKMINVGNQQLFVAKRAKLDGNKIDIQRKSS